MSQLARPGFPPLQLEDFDARLDAEAARRGIPALTTPMQGSNDKPAPADGKAEACPTVVTPKGEAPAPATETSAKRRAPRRKLAPKAPQDNQATPRSRMKSLNVELPDYVWVELKSRAARDGLRPPYHHEPAQRCRNRYHHHRSHRGRSASAIGRRKRGGRLTSACYIC